MPQAALLHHEKKHQALSSIAPITALDLQQWSQWKIQCYGHHKRNRVQGEAEREGKKVTSWWKKSQKSHHIFDFIMPQKKYLHQF